jgi:FdhE protein
LTPEAWLAAHPYLKRVAEVAREIDDAAAHVQTPQVPGPDWDGYLDDFRGGLPLLRSSQAGVDLEPAGQMTVALAERLSSGSSGDRAIAGLSILDRELRRATDAPRRIAALLLGDESMDLPEPGLLRYLGWAAAARYLAPVVAAFAGWRDEERWLRRYCPTCGSLPAMAQLIGAETGRVRWLSCGSCRTRWRFARTLCPFCEKDALQVATMTIEGEGGLRIDYCPSCKGYLKTYDGQGNEAVLLADWTSLHLDVAARDRGLTRLAASLFDLGSLLPASA